MVRVEIVAFDRDLRSRQELGRTHSDARGNYRIAYTRARFARAEKDSADLLLQVKRGDDVLHESPIVFNAGPDAEVDLVVSAESAGSEFEELLDELKGLLGEHDLADLVQDDDHDDIAFLAGETGRDESLITFAVLAHRREAETGIVPSAFYGLFRSHLPTDLPSLLAVERDLVRQGLESALAQNIVPAALRDHVEEIMRVLDELRVKHASASTGDPTRPALTDILEVAGADTAVRSAFIARYVRHQGTIKQFWDEVRADADLGAHAEAFARTLQFSALSGHHLPLVRRLQQEGHQPRDLAAFAEGDWLGRIEGPGGIGVPASITGSDEHERALAYARLMRNAVENAFPTAVVTAHLVAEAAPQNAGMITFLQQNAEYNIVSDRLPAYLAAHPGVLAGGADPDGTARGIDRLQRVYRCAPRYEQASVLLADGIDSAAAITRIGRSDFVRIYEARLGGQAEALRVVDRAARTSARALHLLAEFSARFNQTALGAVTAQASEPPPEVPDWETLFGSLDMCACDHCRSVYSPAAYFVDVLNFLHDRAPAGPVLLQRRPDLGEIELTCENTNTPLPYIDLVNEVLEAAVAPLPPFVVIDLPTGAVASLDRRRITPTIRNAFTPVLAPSARITVVEPGERWTIDDQVASYAVHLDGGHPQVWRRGLQTRGSANELAANPEYLITAAYEKLRSAVFPWSLPFDLWTATVRGYLAQLRVDRAELMRLMLGRMTGPSSSGALAIAAERLGLTQQDRRIVTAQPLIPPRDLAELWGLPMGTPVAFTTVRDLLDRSGLTYQRLLDLLTTRFVNPDAELTLRSKDPDDQATCDPAKLELAGLDDDALDRIHRFERLRARLGWTAADLDLAISSLRGRLDGTLIRRLAPVTVLRKRMRLDLDQVLALWTEISTAGEASLYRRLFQNPAVLSPVDPAFALAGTELADPTQPISTHAATIQAALRIDAAALDAAMTRTAGDRLDLANLSTIHRITILARAARMSVPDTVRLLNLALVDPFAVAHPEETVRFLDLADLLRSAGFSVAQLDHLLRHAPLGPGAEAAADSVIALRLGELRGGLRTIATEHADVTTDPTGELVRAALSLLLAPPDVDLAMSLLAGTWNDLPAATAFVTTHLVPFPAMADAVARLVGPDPTVAAGEPRFRYVGDALRPHLRRVLSEQYVIQTLATGIVLDVEVARTILGARLGDLLAPVLVQDDPELPITPANLPVQFATLRRLDKIALVARTLSFTATQIGWIVERGLAAGWYDVMALPVTPTTSTATDFAAFVRLIELSRICAALPGGEAVLDGVFVLADDPTATHADVVAFLGERLGWAEEDVEFLLGPQVLGVAATAAAFGDELVVARLLECLGPIRLLGVSARQVRAWATPELDAAAAHAAVHAVKSKYGDDEWLTLAPQLRDRLREQQRAALVAYLVGTGPWRDANALYAHFLIDVEMSPCALTSRIKQAAAAAQLFAQRCLLNLEPAVQGATADHEAWERWRWMKTYRVWEANRKVFLYPENWVQPELRDDKSVFFREFEDEIAQADVTPALVEDAFVHYLEKLDDVAWLDVVAEYHEQEFHPTSGALEHDVLHVIARSFTSPRRYYYRRRHDGDRWTGWEPVNLDIVGDQIVAVVWNRRLHLCWLTFTEQTEEAPITMPAPNATMDEPVHYWKIQLAWSEYKRGRWVAKRLSEQWVRGEMIEFNNELPPRHAFTCKAFVDNAGLRIRVSAYLGIFHPWPLAQFTFDGCGSAPLVERLRPALEFGSDAPVVLPSGTLMEGMQLVERGQISQDRLILQDGDFPNTANRFTDFPFLAARRDITTLQQTPGRFRLLTAAQDEQFTSQRPFFYTDKRRSYHVIPRDRRIPDIALPDQDDVDPGSLDGELAPLRAVRLSGRFRASKRYRFEAFSHPYVCSLVRDLHRDGVGGLLTRANQARRADDFATVYGPRQVVDAPYPPDEVDFSYRGAYSLYNWELFFHAPLLVADRLTRNQQFEAAQAWLHYIFDPTDAGGGAVPERYWRTLPFYEAAQSGADRVRIDELLRRIADQAPDPEADAMVQDWLDHPFQPHAVARLRPGAYQKTVVMRYIDNLLQWGDHLFATDRGEAINEATQLYVLAAEILGRRPEQVPPRATTDVHTYTSLQSRLVDFSNALVEIESFVAPSAPATTSTDEQPQLTLPPMMYFCVPANDVLLKYWDDIADRLFKIRNCMNIAGQRRQLPLFDPPIDPAMLVAAQAAGVDIGTVLSDAHARAPHHRYAVLAQKAAQLCGDLKGLGAALLSAMEKRDAEELTLLRSTHEIGVLKATLTIRQRQVEEATRTLEGLRRTQELAQLRYDFYRTRAFMSPTELISEKLAIASMGESLLQSAAEIYAMTVYPVPDFKGGSPTTTGFTYGGTHLGAAARLSADVLRTKAALLSGSSAMTATQAGYERRADDWKLQEQLAAKEVEQIDQQIAAAEIRLAISEREVALHEQQMENASALDEMMRTKYTNRELYDWTVGQISTIYFQSYRLAYELAQRAERAFRRELGLQESSFVQFGHWDSLKQGLVAGERLHLDLQRMDSAYLDQRSREYELTRHVSLAQLDPTALVLLRQTGECFVSLPEALFDLDCPGHYLRRIQSVSLSIPCVTGPYTSVNCTLRQLKSSIRYSSELSGDQYVRQQPDDLRFGDTVGTTESIVTSSGVTDGGVFELNARDERYLPFEGSGVISDWHLALPAKFRQFDFDTIADVVLHIQYTARDGGPDLKKAALTELDTLVNFMVLADGRKGLALLLSARRDLSHQWPRFLNPAAGDQTLTVDLTQNRFPYLFTGRQIRIETVDVFVKVRENSAATAQNLKITLAPGTTASTQPLPLAEENGLLHGQWATGSGALGDWTLAAWLDNGGSHQLLGSEGLNDILLVAYYSV